MLMGVGITWELRELQTMGQQVAAAGSQHLWEGGCRVVKICQYFKRSQKSRFFM